MSTVRRSAAPVLRATPKSPSGSVSVRAPSRPGRQVAEGRVAQAQVGVDDRLDGRRPGPPRRASPRSRPAPAAGAAAASGDQPRARQHRPRRHAQLARQRQRQRDAAAAAARQRRSRAGIGQLVGRPRCAPSPSRRRAAASCARRRRSPGAAPAAVASCRARSRSAGETRSASCELLAEVARPAPPARRPLDARTDGTYSIGGHRRALGEQLRDARAPEGGDARAVGTAARCRGPRRAGAASSASFGAGGRDQHELAAAIGASNDWKKKRSPRNPGANAADGARVSSSSHSM